VCRGLQPAGPPFQFPGLAFQQLIGSRQFLCRLLGRPQRLNERTVGKPHDSQQARQQHQEDNRGADPVAEGHRVFLHHNPLGEPSHLGKQHKSQMDKQTEDARRQTQAQVGEDYGQQGENHQIETAVPDQPTSHKGDHCHRVAHRQESNEPNPMGNSAKKRQEEQKDVQGAEQRCRRAPAPDSELPPWW
jgi:hypothetical protein